MPKSKRSGRDPFLEADYSKMTPEEIAAHSREKFRRFVDWQEKNWQKSDDAGARAMKADIELT